MPNLKEGKIKSAEYGRKVCELANAGDMLRAGGLFNEWYVFRNHFESPLEKAEITEAYTEAYALANTSKG